jgi:hypothetical protein
MSKRTTYLLTNIAIVSFITIVAVPSVLLAQTAQGVIAACASDVRDRCNAKTQIERQACVEARFGEFSSPCQLAVVKYAALRKACGQDIKKTCAGILPGGRRIEVCIKDHFADLSAACKETILQAAGKE